MFERADGAVAEMVRVKMDDLKTFKDSMELAIDIAYALEPVDPIEATEGVLWSAYAIEKVLAIFDCAQLIHVINDIGEQRKEIPEQAALHVDATLGIEEPLTRPEIEKILKMEMEQKTREEEKICWIRGDL
ncbi:hypothetical protein DPSP01_007308 [Paraphaeosphaeria sporulosa]